ncbi:TniQ family protein [Paenibacillus sp. VMFN-D1]|uniref:TniQ family protein n=1 Tax=Paenibacillus sp. VMFN-D1 TaxID=2135608 RepID=UPI000E23A66A|nr:TniQ family protein [Paenibacillus sp. VMFN-D1]RED37365.1 TniQ protein [Paenibacillus sp. VMFN-D1]
MLFLSVPYPKKDEAFFSYIIRLSKDNRCGTTHVFEKLGIRSRMVTKQKRFRLNSLSADDTVRLCNPTFLGSDVIGKSNFLIHHPGPSPVTFDFELNDIKFPFFLINKNYIKICPHCMCSRPYLRNSWFLMPITTCPLHNSMLIDRCTACQSNFQLNDQLLDGCSKCFATWAEMAFNTPNSLTEIDSTLSNLIQFKLGIISDYCSNLCSDFKNLSLANIGFVLSLIAWVSPNEKSFVRPSFVEQESNTLTHDLLLRSIVVFSNWPNSFNYFLEDIISKQKYHNPSKDVLKSNEKIRGRRMLFGEFVKKLRDEFTAPEYNFIKKALLNFLTEKYPHLLSRYNPGVLLNTSINKQYLSATEVINKFGFRRENIKKFIHSGFLEGTIIYQNKVEFIVVTEDSVESLIRLQEESLSTKEVCDRLGFSKIQSRHVFDLLDKGLIKIVRGPTLDGHKWHRFDRNSIDQLLLSFENNLVEKSTTTGVGFNSVTGPLSSHYHPTFAKIAEKVMAGVLKPCRKDPFKIGLFQYQFEKEDLQQAFLIEISKYKEKRLTERTRGVFRTYK